MFGQPEESAVFPSLAETVSADNKKILVTGPVDFAEAPAENPEPIKKKLRITPTKVKVKQEQKREDLPVKEGSKTMKKKRTSAVPPLMAGVFSFEIVKVEEEGSNVLMRVKKIPNAL